MPSARHQTSGREQEPAMYHLEGIKLVAGCCQGQHLVISLCNFCLPYVMSVFGILQLSLAVLIAMTTSTVNGPCKCQHFHPVQNTNRAARGSTVSFGRHQKCGRTSTFIMLKVHSVARANILSSGRHQNCGKDSTFI